MASFNMTSLAPSPHTLTRSHQRGWSLSDLASAARRCVTLGASAGVLYVPPRTPPFTDCEVNHGKAKIERERILMA